MAARTCCGNTPVYTQHTPVLSQHLHQDVTEMLGLNIWDKIIASIDNYDIAGVREVHSRADFLLFYTKQNNAVNRRLYSSDKIAYLPFTVAIQRALVCSV